VIPRLLHLWERLRGSLWFVPAGMSLAAAALALLAGRLDTAVAATDLSLPFLYPGDRDGARTLLSTVAGSMITVAGVTFSVTVVALSLASSQFGPRLLLNFMRDRGNQLVLGTFIATFLFCLLALGQGTDEPGMVPRASATVGLLLALASVAVLIFFIHHVSSSIHAERVVDSVSRDLDRAVERLFPPGEETNGEQAGGGERPPAIAGESDPGGEQAPLPDLAAAPVVAASDDGYLQLLDEERLVALAVEHDLVLQALRRPGHFVVAGEPLVRVAGRGGAASATEIPPELAKGLRACFVQGRRRSHEQDPEYGIHQLVEVAVRALSPGVNDPYTALSCIDWLGAVLCKVAARPLCPPQRLGPEGGLRLLVDPLTFEGMLAAAFDQIRQCAKASPAVSMRILEVLASIARSARDPQRRAAARAQADMVFHGALAAGLQECDRRDLEARYTAVTEVLQAAEAASGPVEGGEG